MTKRSILSGLLLLFVTTILVSSCSDNAITSNRNAKANNWIYASGNKTRIQLDSISNIPKWKAQLQKAVESINKGKLSHIPLKIVSYKRVGTISNSKELKKLENKFLSKKRYIPQYTLTTPDKILLRLKKAKNIDKSKSYKYFKPLAYNRKELQAYLDRKMAIGETVIAVKWKYKNRFLITRAIASSAKGIIYGSIGSNITTFHMKPASYSGSPILVDSLRKRSQLKVHLNSIGVIPCEHIPDFAPRPAETIIEKHTSVKSPVITFEGVFGGTQGKAYGELKVEGYILKRPAYPNEKYLTCAKPHGHCFYEKGECGARVKILSADYSENGMAQAAYGLFLHKGQGSLTLAFGYGGFYIEASGTTSGKTKKDMGQLIFYAQDWFLFPPF